MDQYTYAVGRKCLQKLFEVEMGKKLDFNKMTRVNGFRCVKKLPELPFHGWQAGEIFKVKLLGLNPSGLFVVKMMRDKKSYEDLKLLLKEYCNKYTDDEKSKPIEMDSCSVGDLVCCNAGNDVYIRGTVLKVDDVLKLCFVLDIDEYRSYALEWSRVFLFSPEFRALPARVVPCLLEGVNSRNFAFQPAIHGLLSRTHGNVIVKVIDPAERKRWDGAPLVQMNLPNGQSLSELIIRNIHRHADELPLISSQAAFLECEKAVALLPFVCPLLRFEKYGRSFDGEDAEKMESEAHINMESFFRNQCGQVGQRMAVDTVYGIIASLNHRVIRWKELGYRHWYCCLYSYHHLFEVKSSPSDHEGKLYIEPGHGNGSEEHGQHLLELKPEVLLSIIPEIKVDAEFMKYVNSVEASVAKVNGNSVALESGNTRNYVDCGTRSRIDSSSSSIAPLCAVPLQPLNRNRMNNRQHQRNGKPRFSKDVLEKDAEIAEQIASAVTFPPEVPPSVRTELQLEDLTEEISPYIFYPQEWASLNEIFPKLESSDTNISISLPETKIIKEDTKISDDNYLEEDKQLCIESEEVEHLVEEEKSIELDCPQAFLRVAESFSAKLCGSDTYGFFYIQRCDPGYEENYSLLHQNIQDFYESDKMQTLFRLTPSAINVGDIAIAEIDGEFLRCRIFQYRTSKHVCNVVDLEDHDFHEVVVGKLYKPILQFLKLPPKAIVCVLRGLEHYMFTEFISDGMARTTLGVDDVLDINVVESFEKNLRVPLVSMKLSNGEDMSKLIITNAKVVVTKRNPDDFASSKPWLQVYLPRVCLKM